MSGLDVVKQDRKWRATLTPYQREILQTASRLEFVSTRRYNRVTLDTLVNKGYLMRLPRPDETKKALIKFALTKTGRKALKAQQDTGGDDA